MADFGMVRGTDSPVERGHSHAGGIGQHTNGRGLLAASLLAAVREASHHPTIPHPLQAPGRMVLSVNRGDGANVHPDWLMHGCFSLYCNHLDVLPPALSSLAASTSPRHTTNAPAVRREVDLDPTVTRLHSGAPT